MTKSAARRLVFLETQDAELSRRLHQDTRRRERYQAEMRELRMRLTATDREEYEQLKKFERMLAPQKGGSQ